MDGLRGGKPRSEEERSTGGQAQPDRPDRQVLSALPVENFSRHRAAGDGPDDDIREGSAEERGRDTRSKGGESVSGKGTSGHKAGGSGAKPKKEKASAKGSRGSSSSRERPGTSGRKSSSGQEPSGGCCSRAPKRFGAQNASPERAAMDLIDHLTEATDKPVMLHLSGTRLDMGELAEEKERLRITNQVFLRDATFDWCNKPPAIDDTRHMRPGVHVCTNDAWLDLAPDREPWVKKFVVFEGVTFTGVAGFRSCLLHVERCSHVVLRRCVFRGSDHDGVFISGGSYVRMEGCTIAGCRGAGVRVDDRSRLDMVDCEVVGNGYGVLAGGAGTTVSVQGKGTLIQLNSKAGVTAGKQAAVFFRNGRVYRNGQASEQRPKEDKDLLERECGLLAESGGLLVVGRRGGVIEAHARLASRSKRRVELRDGYVMGRRRDHPPPLIQDNVVGILNVGGVVEFADTGVVLTAPRMGDSLVDVAIDGVHRGRWIFSEEVHLSENDVERLTLASKTGEISAALPVAGADAAGVTNEWASEGGDSDELDPSRYAPRNTRLSAGNTKRAQQFGPVYG